MRVSPFTILSIAMISLSTVASADEILSVDSLSKLVTEKHISSVEDLLPALPEDFRSNTLYVYESQSTQYADPLNPRAILSSQNSNLIMAIQSGSAPDSQRVELIQFDPKKRAFDFFEGTFAGGKPALFLPRTDCARCHRDDMRPNWQAYFHWAGVYGSDDGSTHGRLSPPDEDSKYTSFMAKASHDPRYQWLSQKNGLRTNLDFTEVQGNRNFARMARILTETPHYQQFKYAYLGSTLCNANFTNFLPDHLKPLIQTSWPRLDDRADGKTQKNPLYYLLDMQGLRYGDYSMTFKETQTSFDPYFTTPRYASNEIGYAFLQDIPEAKDMVNVDQNIYTSDYPGVHYAAIKSTLQCEQLARMSVQALTGFVPYHAPAVQAPPARVSASFTSCKECHVGPSHLAPYIPFDNEIALKAALTDSGNRLYHELLSRISTDAPSSIRMPPKENLEQTDRETIRSYVDTLMR